MVEILRVFTVLCRLVYWSNPQATRSCKNWFVQHRETPLATEPDRVLANRIPRLPAPIHRPSPPNSISRLIALDALH